MESVQFVEKKKIKIIHISYKADEKKQIKREKCEEKKKSCDVKL